MMNQNSSFKKSETYSYINSLFCKNYADINEAIKKYKFSNENIKCLMLHLHNDMNDTIYKMAFSFISAFIDLKNNNYSWATIKFYYSIYYYVKSKLLFDGIHITYFNKNAYAFNINNKNKFIKLKNNNSHQAVFEYYNTIYYQRDPLLMLEIPDINNCETKKVYEWYEDKRNIINYRSIRFEEPYIYKFWEAVNEYKNIEDLFNNIIKDKNNIYVTDEDYAIIAVPVYCLTDLILNTNFRTNFTDTKYNYLINMISDNSYCTILFNIINKNFNIHVFN